MDAVRHRTLRNKIDNTFWNPDSTCKLVKFECAASVAVGGFSRCIMCPKCSNNYRGNAAYDLRKEVINKRIAPLQVRSDKESENRIVSKYMVIVRNTQ